MKRMKEIEDRKKLQNLIYRFAQIIPPNRKINIRNNQK